MALNLFIFVVVKLPLIHSYRRISVLRSHGTPRQALLNTALLSQSLVVKKPNHECNNTSGINQIHIWSSIRNGQLDIPKMTIAPDSKFNKNREGLCVLRPAL